MKIRIQDNSVRFRLTLREVETLEKEGRIERVTRVLNADGPAGVFRYAIVAVPSAAESTLELDGASIEFRLAPADLAVLLDPTQEGVYLRREWSGRDGETQRFMAFAEKDRPGSTCVKPEAWIYDAQPGHPPETRPIPGRNA
ncbi:MAG: hypothetical protein PWP23_2537 [Candidatus Sumerlaeota bacterium]|nr:hypothetical protein [Candidatus Sumerlaeota bacterium]